jgi:hypothetical protein
VSRLTETYLQGVSQLDVLFVIDNTADMSGVQQDLATSIPHFVDLLNATRVDFRLGVISSDLGIDPYLGPGCEVSGGDGAALQNSPRSPGCTPPPDRYITSTNVADPAAAFACIASLGEEGCGFERPIEAALHALETKSMPQANQGFLRGAAALLLVWVTNEDDCSATDPGLYDPDATGLGPWTSYRCFSEDISCAKPAPDGTMTGCHSGKGAYALSVEAAAERLKGLKPEGLVTLMVVAGPASPVKVTGYGTDRSVEPSCTGTKVSARPAIRFQELLGHFADNGAMVSICQEDLGGKLVDALPIIRQPGLYCLRHAILDPARPGCSVEVVLASGQRVSVSPSGLGSPGFHLVHPVAAGCASGALAFDDAARPPVGATVELTCSFAP